MTNHPILPCGYNSWENDGDEVDGAGVNEPIWPTYLNAFVPLRPLILTDEFEDIFVNGDPDLVFACDEMLIVYPFDPNLYLAVNTWPTFVLPAEDSTICFKAADRAFVVSQTWTDTATSPVADPTITLPAGTQTKELT